jgi:cell wall-associated NlpC family hydrolase
MLDSIQAALAEESQPFADKRVHVCQLEVTAVADNRYALGGAALDQETIGAIVTGLSRRFPGTHFEAEAVRVLRRAGNPTLVVTTNVTGLQAEPSFAAEQSSQLLNGAALEPLLIEANWAFVRQADGYLGWAYRLYLAEGGAPRPTHLLAQPVARLRDAPDDEASLVSRFFAGTGVRVADERAGWCCVELAGGWSGWLRAAALRPLDDLPREPAAQRRQIVADAFRFGGVPYLWGGVSGLGIDCSGLAQQAHALSGLVIPRDADMQFNAGRPVEPPFQPGDLLFYGSGGDHRRISHVAISLGDWRVIHSSRSRNGVYVDDMATAGGDWLMRIFAGARSFIAA